MTNVGKWWKTLANSLNTDIFGIFQPQHTQNEDVRVKRRKLGENEEGNSSSEEEMTDNEEQDKDENVSTF